MEVVEAAEEWLEEKFPPKPGGLVARARERAAKERAEQDEATNAAEPIEQASYKAVKVVQQSPEVLAAQTITIQSGGYAPVLPISPYRYRAIIMVATAEATVVLCKDASAAIGQNGFTLPYGIPFPTFTRAQMYAYNNTASAVQVSVMAELYAPEK